MKDLLRDPELVSEIASALRAAEARRKSPACREDAREDACACEGACDSVCDGAHKGGAVRGDTDPAHKGADISPAAALVSALKPYLNPHRREKAEALTKALSAAEIYRGLRNARG